MANILSAAETADEATSHGSAAERILTDEELTELARRNILAALRTSGWRVSGPKGAAQLLGIKPTTLADRMKKLGISRAENTAA